MYLGLDLGTSELKAVILAPDHRIVAQASAPLSARNPRPLWSEQDPADWVEALAAVCDKLAAAHPQDMAAVRGIGLAGQMHGAVLLDGADQVLRPAILWNDGRSAAQCRALDAAMPSAPAVTGNYAMPGFTAPKLLWVREHEPEIFAQVRTVLLPKDYLRLVLSGDKVTDCSDASGTFWFDIAARGWSPAMLAAGGMEVRQMPRVIEGSAASGTLRASWARRWGMRDSVVIAGGGGDNAASAVGMGIVAAGQGIVSLGTSGVIFLVSNGFAPNPPAAIHAFCHALAGTWHQMSVMLSAASCLRWVTNLTGRGSEAELLAEVETMGPDERAVAPVFLPYLSGERTPHNDPAAQAGFVGLTRRHGPAALGYAVIEGVGFGLRDGLASLAGAGGAPAELLLAGGGSRSPVWSQLLADILGLPLVLAEGSETAGARGAARLAWLADGGDMAQACAAPVVVRRISPGAGQTAALDRRFATFRAAYPALRPLAASGG
jgi:xylulokinase